VIELPDAESVVSIAFMPDGKSLIVHVRERAINVWELMHHYWPEEIGALLVFAVLVLLRAIIHVRLHPQRKGEPHCRKCGYCLSGVPEGPCPECGLDRRVGGQDRGRFPGRSAMRRLRWAIAPIVLIGAVYGGLFAAGVGRWSKGYEKYSVWSTQLVRLAHTFDAAWLLSRTEYPSRFVVLDHNQLRQRYAYSGSERSKSILLFDGSFIPESDGLSIERRSGEDGRVLQRLSVQVPPLLGRCEKFLVHTPVPADRAVIIETIAMHPEDVDRDLPLFKWNLEDRSVVIASRADLEVDSISLAELRTVAASDLKSVGQGPDTESFWIHAMTPDRSHILCQTSRAPEFVVAEVAPNGKWRSVWRTNAFAPGDLLALADDGKLLARARCMRRAPLPLMGARGGTVGASIQQIEIHLIP